MSGLGELPPRKRRDRLSSAQNGLSEEMHAVLAAVIEILFDFRQRKGEAGLLIMQDGGKGNRLVELAEEFRIDRSGSFEIDPLPPSFTVVAANDFADVGTGAKDDPVPVFPDFLV